MIRQCRGVKRVNVWKKECPDESTGNEELSTVQFMELGLCRLRRRWTRLRPNNYSIPRLPSSLRQRTI
jgi:hypothetical protein